MSRVFVSLLALVVVAIFVAAATEPESTNPELVTGFATPQASQAEYDRTVVPFLAAHCTACHDDSRSEGDLNLRTLAADMKASTSGARWAMVVEKLAAGTMPPKGRPRPPAAAVTAVMSWARSEAKRSGKVFTRREQLTDGNRVPHDVLFDTTNIPPFASQPRIRPLIPEIYAGLTSELAKDKPGIGQPFSPAGHGPFADLGTTTIDEPTTAQLMQNALAIVEVQTAHKVENGKIKGLNGSQKEFVALLDPKQKPTDDQLTAAIARQFELILRRPPTANESARFLALANRNMSEAGQAIGVRYTLAAVLLLPEAVFRMEVGRGPPDKDGRIRLAPREIAFALSYALTDRRPDAKLLAAAATGGLDRDAGVAAEVRRMLAEPKLDRSRVLRFFREYFGYADAVDVFKETKQNPDHDARALVEDTDQLVRFILEQDRDVLRELLTTNKSFVAYKSAADLKKKRAEALQKFEAEKARNPEKFKTKQPPRVGRSIFEAYGLDDFPDQQPVELPPDQRAGILTQPSWLVARSTSFDNHAIHRGKWIRERLLGGVVPDIPITVDAQLPDAPHQTLRERMKVTQQDYCWKCHQLMNGLGLPFEQYDHFGRYRTGETVLDRDATEKNVDKKGKPLGPIFRDVSLDTTGLVAHTGIDSLEGTVRNPVEMIRRLADSERVEQVFVRHAFRYFLGRNESPGDAASLQAAHRAYRENQGSMNALIVALLSSESFLYRVPAPAEGRP